MRSLFRRPAAVICTLVALVLLTGAGYAYTAAVTGRMIASLSLTETDSTGLSGTVATVSPSVALTLSYTDGTDDGEIDLKLCKTDSIAASGADTFDLRGSLTDEFGDATVFAEIAAFAVEAYTTNTNNVLVGGKFPGHWDTMLQDSSAIALKPGFAMVVGGRGTGYVVTANSADTLIFRNSAGSSQVKYDFCIAGRSS